LRRQCIGLRSMSGHLERIAAPQDAVVVTERARFAISPRRAAAFDAQR
jgi:hypothetical protein